MKRSRMALLTAITVLVAATPALGARLTKVADGFSKALLVTAPDNDPRLFVVEQPGRIRIVQPDGSVAPQPFLDISGLVSTGNEQGLLGLAFHPQYASNGRFFVNYTNRAGATIVAQFKVSTANPNVANPASRRRLMAIAQPYENHNGGMVAFGPDGYLYIGMGDGGSAGDPQNRAQNMRSLLGKMLRIDVNGVTKTRRYVIPKSNPFRGRKGVPPEIFALGLRNPWRFSFDRARGDLWIGDVGQNTREEINFTTANNARAANYGWKRFEGRSRFSSTRLSAGRLVQPVAVYDHGQGCSVTGGYVYRGPSIPGLDGQYVFGDFCSGRIWAMTAGPTPGKRVEITGSLGASPGNIYGFGEGSDGRMYLASGETVWRFTN